ncbi:hypothetical protein HYDPIDRAFT_166739 [Hydnomerulius pinastri MD-312]|nr:hypothetical protein HYDPIDRAFT_166739 [Hydnomerulius pinastri MD-312]
MSSSRPMLHAPCTGCEICYKEIPKPISGNCLQRLCYPPTAVPVFPNLRLLVWDNPTPEFLPFIRQLAGPKLTHLSFIAREAAWSATELSVLGSLRNLSPNLNHVTLLPSRMNVNSADTISDLLCNWRDLRTVHCRFINIDALSHLSHLTTLEELDERGLQVDFLKTQRFKPDLKFPARSLDAVDKLHLPFVTHHDVEVQNCPMSESLRSYLTVLQNSCAHDRLDSFQMDQIGSSVSVDSQPHRLTSEDFRPLTSFGNLTTIIINVAGSVDVDDNGLLTLASSWPRLENFELNEEHGWRTSRGITPRGLARLLRKCKSLSSLDIVIDTRGFTEVPEKRLSRGVSKFDTTCRPEAGGYRSLWEEVQAQAEKFRQVREQERRRRE